MQDVLQEGVGGSAFSVRGVGAAVELVDQIDDGFYFDGFPCCHTTMLTRKTAIVNQGIQS